VKVAVAANFTEPVREIAPLFERTTGHGLVASFGANGQLFAQISQGAPFEVLLSADTATPRRLAADGLAVKDSQFTYALGRLVLYSRLAGFVTDESTLKAARFRKIALANPAVAPYGAAAYEAMLELGVHKALQGKIVQGLNIAQTLQFVETGNAELGFVALAQVATAEGGSRWVVPAGLHAPITQDAVLLKAGAGNAAGRCCRGRACC
jgi:molybdate transport system substrate-binding protein